MVNLLTREQDDVVFYTVVETGESGINLAGLAKLCGVSRHTVDRFVSTVVSPEAPVEVQAIARQSITLVEFDQAKDLDGKDPGRLRVFNSKFCIAAITHYATQKGRKEAIFTLAKFAQMGFNHWVHEITGWQESVQPRQLTQAYEPPRYLLSGVESVSEVTPDARDANLREMHQLTDPNSAPAQTCQAVSRILKHSKVPLMPYAMSNPAAVLEQQTLLRKIQQAN